ncbi:PIR Superfamily Protein [Plasmodium ovale wallikeri]|uniref:PIR Superfamily Protein n=1 Tax=Plasmodium ovale wallikeri TaxID=864142 RepID=A0A1A9ALW5_PLAOA|nr:PIR Superfamily Protein [Plasmodium ovale wallikeri]SBT57638.1 PIR Superfamily Protein [Plasmodium ovale wallikeri]
MEDSYNYENVKNFPAYKNLLEQSWHDYSFNETGDPVVNTCRQNENANTVRGFSFIHLCIKINKYIEYYSDPSKHSSDLHVSNNGHREYLNYWLNDKYKNNNDYSLYKDVLDSKDPLKIFNSNIRNISEYKSKIYELGDDIFNRVDTLYKLYDQYLSYITKREYSITNEILCKHADEFADIYNKAIGECNNKLHNKYCKELEYLKQRYEGNISKTSCPKTPLLLSPHEAYTYKADTFGEHLPSDDNDSYSVGDMAILAGKILGGCFIPLLLYKYTPLGSCLRPRKRKNKTNWDNIDDGTHVNYSYYYGNEETIPYNEEYNMHYYSSQNYE